MGRPSDDVDREVTAGGGFRGRSLRRWAAVGGAVNGRPEKTSGR